MLAIAAGLSAIPTGAAAPNRLRFEQRVIGVVDGLSGAAFDLVAGDFDGRPPVDVAISVNRGTGQRGGLQLVLNRGEGYNVGPFVLGGAAPYTIGAGDFDGDGDLDAAAPNTAWNDVSVYTNDGAGTFQAGLPLSAQHHPRGVAIADYNADGRPDVATSAGQPTGGGSAYLLVFYRNRKNTGFDPPIVVEPASQDDSFNPLDAIVARDFNADGLIDIAGVDTRNLVISYREPDNSGFAPVATVSSIDSGTTDLAAGDLNRDGLMDLALSSVYGPHITVVFRRSNNTGFMPPQYLYVNHVTAKVAIADIDGDRRNDVAVSSLNDGKVAVILRRRNNRGFEAPLFFNVGPHPVALDAADIDADGDTDLVVGDRSGLDIRLLLNQRRHGGLARARR